MMKLKGKGAGIMISDYIYKHHGFLAPNDEEYECVKLADPSARKYVMNMGREQRGLYWMHDRLSNRSSELLILQRLSTQRLMDGTLCRYLNMSCCHGWQCPWCEQDPGSKQRLMRDTVWQDRVQKMTYSVGVPKGMRVILQERGIDTQKWLEMT